MVLLWSCLLSNLLLLGYGKYTENNQAIIREWSIHMLISSIRQSLKGWGWGWVLFLLITQDMRQYLLNSHHSTDHSNSYH